jgi:formylglycine-generating enzyme required for sulfatase activity
LVTGYQTRQGASGAGSDARATVEVAHEALIQRWPTLRAWVAANRENLRARTTILRAKKEWEEHGEHEKFLLDPGVQLERGRALLDNPGDVPVDDIKDYVGRSIEKDERRLDAEREADLADQKRIADAERQAREAADEAAGQARGRAEAETRAKEAAREAARQAEARAAVEIELRTAAEQRTLVEQAARNDAEVSARKLRMALIAAVGAGSITIATLLIVANREQIQDEWNWMTVMQPYRAAEFDGHALTLEGEHALKHGDSFRECAKDCPEMVVVPAGAFWMGSPDGTKGAAEEGRYDNEGPLHTVTISDTFAVAKKDVTFAEWDACANVGGCAKDIEDFGAGRGDHPVVGVTFDDAQRYAAWLSLMTGRTYRLLSEAEWEYCARAGTQTAYPWGDEVGMSNANCNGCRSPWDAKHTSRVASFAPNAFSLYDMIGNVAQWTDDCYHYQFAADAPADGRPWISKECGTRVIRGGSWSDSPKIVRAAKRGSGTPGSRGGNLGFRVARVLAQ